jgi:hypothetical protein
MGEDYVNGPSFYNSLCLDNNSVRTPGKPLVEEESGPADALHYITVPMPRISKPTPPLVKANALARYPIQQLHVCL